MLENVTISKTQTHHIRRNKYSTLMNQVIIKSFRIVVASFSVDCLISCLSSRCSWSILTTSSAVPAVITGLRQSCVLHPLLVISPDFPVCSHTGQIKFPLRCSTCYRCHCCCAAQNVLLLWHMASPFTSCHLPATGSSGRTCQESYTISPSSTPHCAATSRYKLSQQKRTNKAQAGRNCQWQLNPR